MDRSIIKTVAGTVLFVLFLFPNVAFSAERNGGKPRWLSTLPIASNNTFEYRVVTIDAGNISEARGLVPQELTHYLETSKKVQITSVSKEAFNSSNGSVSEETSFNMMAVVEGTPINIVAKIVDEYFESNGKSNTYYFLCAVGNPKASAVNFDKVQITDKYGAQGLWRSAIVPGWGQMYKGSSGKGFAILGAEVVAVGGIVAFESMRSSYVTKIHKQPQFAQQYASKASNCQNIRNGFIAGAAAIYVYNLIDAIAAPGARWLKTSNKGLAFYPSVSQDYAGFTVSYAFN
mgnify:CR=1 FL=1